MGGHLVVPARRATRFRSIGANPMIETNALRQETLRENTHKPRLFAVIETPEPGWTTRKIEHAAVLLGEDAEWHVEMFRLADGATVNFHHPSLHVAWLRACERAHMESNDLAD